MSLHAKELFHSNFLAWLGLDEELRSIFIEAMKAMGFSTDRWPVDFRVEREKDNFDLLVTSVDGSKWYAVIENKVKSIPSEEQLKRYDSKIQKRLKEETCQKRLLSIDNGIESPDTEWPVATYSMITQALRQHLPTDERANEYKYSLIRDYIEMTDSLVEIGSSLTAKESDPFLMTTLPEWEEICKLRLHDLFGKRRMAVLCRALNEQLGLHDNPFKPGYTSGGAIMETGFEINGTRCGIQIEGAQYRHFIMTDVTKSVPPAIAERRFLLDTMDGFRKEMGKNHPRTFIFKEVSGNAKKDYCSYVNKKAEKGESVFLYQYAVIGPDTTVGQLKAAIEADLRKYSTMA